MFPLFPMALGALVGAATVKVLMRGRPGGRPAPPRQQGTAAGADACANASDAQREVVATMHSKSSDSTASSQESVK